MAIKALIIVAFCLMTVCIAKNLYQVQKRIVERPIQNSLQYYLTNFQGKEISSWADIEINLSYDTLTGVIEIPKESAAKLQMVKQIPNHSLMQDTRTNKYNNKIELRHYAIPLPLVNYGFIPMTWQQSIYPDQNGFYGDDDPIDFVDLSSNSRKILDIVDLKVLGAFCLIDEGELDWKVFTIDSTQAEQKGIESHQDIPQKRLQQIIDWFKVYKTYDGKTPNTIGFGQKIFSKQETLEIILDTHVQFLKLKNGQGIEYKAKKQEFNL